MASQRQGGQAAVQCPTPHDALGHKQAEKARFWWVQPPLRVDVGWRSQSACQGAAGAVKDGIYGQLVGGCSCGMGLELASLALCHPQGTLPACLEPRPDPGRAVEAVPRHDKPIPILSPS